MKNTYLLLVALFIVFTSCEDVKTGYLDAANGEYIPDSLIVKNESQLQFANVGDPDYARVKNNAPWVTLRIEKVKGTAPILYEIINVTSPNGGDVAAFRNKLTIRGAGLMEFPLKHGVKKGTYLVSIKVQNESYEQNLKDVYTFIVN